MVRLTWLMVVAVGVLAIVGCGRGRSVGTVPVSGSVTLDDQPLEGARVIFAPTSATAGKSASGVTDASGRFQLTTLDQNDGAVPASYLVTISKTEGQSIVGNVIKPGMPYKEAMELAAKARAEAGKKATAKFKELVPAKYTNPVSSGFKAEVVKGEKNEFKFPMTSK